MAEAINGLILDFDGTLAAREEQVSPTGVELIMECVRLGVKVAIVTGARSGTILSRMGPCLKVLVEGGQIIVLADAGTTRVPGGTAAPQLDVLSRSDRQVVRDVIKRFRGRTELRYWEQPTSLLVSLVNENVALREEIRQTLSSHLVGVAIRLSGSRSLSITSSSWTKAEAVTWISAHWGIPHCEILYIGDDFSEGGNDEPVKSLQVHTLSVNSPVETFLVMEAIVRDIGRVVNG